MAERLTLVQMAKRSSDVSRMSEALVEQLMSS